MKLSNNNQIIAKFKDLIKGSTGKSKLLSDKFYSVLVNIPELITFINEDNNNIKRIIIEELSQNMEIKEYISGNYLRKVLGRNDDFYMILSGKILLLEIKYVKIYMTFNEYILYLTKLYLLKEVYLYKDCLEKNNEIFPFNMFYNYKKYTSKKENEKNCVNEKDKNNTININNINIISLCNDINTKDFNYQKELIKIKNEIKNSAWKKRRNLLKGDNIDYNIIINSFLELYNYNLNVNVNFTTKEIKYPVYIPFFVGKKILEPISFIGNLNEYQIMKNYKGYICLNNSFVIYLDKTLLKQNQSIFKFSNRMKKIFVIDKLFKNHYMFKNMNIDFFNKNFGKYFEIITLKKNDILFKQNEPNKGIYIITKGVIQLKTEQAYNDLNDLNYIFLHSLDNFPNFVNNLRNDKIKNIKKNLFGYYDYNSDTNVIMKNPIFAEKAKEKKEIIFCQYGTNDILGLGEIYDYKNKINIFTAKCISDEAELFFLPNEIFNGLLSDENIYEKCGMFIEEKANTFIRCIAKYKYIFEKKIEYITNTNKNDMKYYRTNLSAKIKTIKNFDNILDKIKNETKNILKYNESYNFNTLKENNDDNNKKNNNILFQKLNHEKNNPIKLKNLIIQNSLEDKNYINYNKNENTYLAKKNLLVMTNISNENSSLQKNLGPSTPIINRNISLNENIKNKKNEPFNLGNKKDKNKKPHLIKSSSTFLNDNAGIKKRMEEMSRYYSGKNQKRNSGPIIISYIDNICPNNKIAYNKFCKEKKLKIKANKKFILGRSLSAKLYEDNNNSMKFNENIKKCEEINKFNNIRPFSCKKENIHLNKKILDNKGNHQKMIINKFLPTSLFPLVNISNEKKNKL